ncbi:MAG: DUF6429 family protein [Saprospiraceae bacterium]
MSEPTLTPEELNQIREDLTLLLLFLNGWQEGITGLDKTWLRSWKGYDHGTLQVLALKDYIQDSPGSKSVTLTDEGETRAKMLAKYYLNKEV